ncbi:General transcription factor II-I repeat domain-containing protein 2B [Eumeta japonica]|uniref:General transcription factor II-I repeat domain-containing protein 2B n=1 Tax=Eumeta variegata TaxID=151549 RepID=A0A4C1VIE8_EUMVA|nr:General transcription factor II-I repeat domain-containing protein 2B [Eumeta japonica]
MMANDIKTTLTDHMTGIELFSISLDESTELSDTAQLAIFIRGVDKEFTVTEWLSKGKILKRFYELRNEIADFMQINNKPKSEVSDPKWICDLAFLVDLTGYLNDLNLKLQKQGQLVNDLYSHLKAFQNKIRLWEAQTLSGNTYRFTTLSAYEDIAYALKKYH